MSHSLYLQCFAGLSGDMFLATLLGLGLPEVHLRRELQKLGIEDEYTLTISSAEKQGINGLRVDVETTNTDQSAAHQHSHGDHHHHGHSHEHSREHSHGVKQRDFNAIKALIEQSTLSVNVKDRALEIFQEVARAEAKIHNQDIEAVHFHEVGATDSVVDIVGAAIGLEYLAGNLAIKQVKCSPIELGSGFVRCAHGEYPVPAPATAEILRDTPVTMGRVKGEATTPTGAAILKVCVSEFTESLAAKVQETVYGIGHRDTNVPNVVRAYVLEHGSLASNQSKQDFAHVKIEANIDDMSPEAYASLYESLFNAGADDVFLQNIMMKKSRPAQLLSVLCGAADADRLGDLVLNNSTTIGLRILPFKKVTLPREIINVPTVYGRVSIKLVVQPSGVQRWKSEHDYVHRIANEIGQPYLEVKSEIDREIHQHLIKQGYLKQVNKAPKEVKSYA